LLDIPGQRSSHTTATPRGGGVALLLLLPASIFASAALGLPGETAAALGGAGALVALIGWIDDHGHVSPLGRAAVHVAAAAWALYWLGGVDSVRVADAELALGAVGTILTLFGIVWLINLYNFMDGIDGLAGGQAVTAGLTAGLLLWSDGAHGLAFVSLSIAATASGFLVWNWPPARIFMGDVGSGLLGALFAILAVASEKTGALPLTCWLVLLAVFVTDATCTLVQRIFSGQQWYTAHRSHVYQRLIQGGWSHRRVTGAALSINVFILAPAAWCMARYPMLAPYLLAIVYLGLGGVWWWVQSRFPAK
jgi:Fuc2NAc and GlcNAc transferase